jgi:SAM-dependent methyltransferase
MASIDENKQVWDTTYDWSQAGDEWSSGWGSPRAQWEGCILPRIFPFLGGRILEIAPGHGRWTQFLEAQCASLIGIDLASSCVEHCKKRFKDYVNLEFQVNDGLALPMVDDASIDFAFSFDSLVQLSPMRSLAMLVNLRGCSNPAELRLSIIPIWVPCDVRYCYGTR